MVILCPIQGNASVAERGMRRPYRKAAANSTTIPPAPAQHPFVGLYPRCDDGAIAERQYLPRGHV